MSWKWNEKIMRTFKSRFKSIFNAQIAMKPKRKTIDKPQHNIGLPNDIWFNVFSLLWSGYSYQYTFEQNNLFLDSFN